MSFSSSLTSPDGWILLFCVCVSLASAYVTYVISDMRGVRTTIITFLCKDCGSCYY